MPKGCDSEDQFGSGVRIEWAIGCESIDDREDGALLLHAPGAETTLPDAFPCFDVWFPLAICLACEYQDIAPGVRHTLTWEVQNPDHEKIAEGGTDLELGERSAWHYPGWVGRIVLAARPTFDAETPGAYTVTLRLDQGEPFVLLRYVALLSDLF